MIKSLVTDVDGVLTDGGMYYSVDGKILKKFGAHDSDGLKLLEKTGVEVTAITADKRGFLISKKRMEHIGIKLTLITEETRYKWFKENYKMISTAFVGDGYHDKECLSSAILSFCPNSAPTIVKNSAKFVTRASGGEGVLLEVALKVIEWNEEHGIK